MLTSHVDSSTSHAIHTNVSQKSVTKYTVKFIHKKVDTLGFSKKKEGYPDIADNISLVQAKQDKKIFELNKIK